MAQVKYKQNNKNKKMSSVTLLKTSIFYGFGSKGFIRIHVIIMIISYNLCR